MTVQKSLRQNCGDWRLRNSNYRAAGSALCVGVQQVKRTYPDILPQTTRMPYRPIIDRYQQRSQTESVRGRTNRTSDH